MNAKLKPKEEKNNEFTNEAESIIEQAYQSDGELVIDAFETDSEFVVLTAIAGIQIKDIDITLEKDMLIIKGNRQEPFPQKEKKYFFQECYWGPFSRKIILPENLDIEKAEAQMDKGVLTIKIPKLNQTSKKEIKIA